MGDIEFWAAYFSQIDSIMREFQLKVLPEVQKNMLLNGTALEPPQINYSSNINQLNDQSQPFIIKKKFSNE